MGLRRNFTQALKGAISAIPEAQQIVERNRAIGAENYREQFNAAPDYQAKQEVANRAATKGNFLQRQGGLADTMNAELGRNSAAATRMGNTALQGYTQKLGSFTEATTPEQASANISDLQALQAKADADVQQLTARGGDVSGLNKFREQVTSEINRLRTSQKALQDEKDKDRDFKEVGMSTLRELVGSSVTDIDPYMSLMATIGITGDKGKQMAMTMVSLAKQMAAKTAAAQNRAETAAMMGEINLLLKTRDPRQMAVARDIAMANMHPDIAENINKMIYAVTPDSKSAKEEKLKDLSYLSRQASQGLLINDSGGAVKPEEVEQYWKDYIWPMKKQFFKDHYTVDDYGNVEDAANAYRDAVSRGADKFRTFSLLTEGVDAPLVDRLRELLGEETPTPQGSVLSTNPEGGFMFNPAPAIAKAGAR